jgi:hypothetical protein
MGKWADEEAARIRRDADLAKMDAAVLSMIATFAVVYDLTEGQIREFEQRMSRVCQSAFAPRPANLASIAQTALKAILEPSEPPMPPQRFGVPIPAAYRVGEGQ